MQKFIIGWMTFKPEMRDRFLAAVRAHVAATRQEEGCVFFDINLSLDTPNGAMVTECFKSQGAHEIHNKTPHMNQFREEMSKVLVEGRFQNIFSDTFTVDEVKFA